MAASERKVEAIANSADGSTFENTIVGDGAQRRAAEPGAACLRQSEFDEHGSDDAAHPARVVAQLAAHNDPVLLTGRLFGRIETLYREREKLGLDSESGCVLERYYKEFVRAVARPSDGDKAKLKEIAAAKEEKKGRHVCHPAGEHDDSAGAGIAEEPRIAQADIRRVAFEELPSGEFDNREVVLRIARLQATRRRSRT